MLFIINLRCNFLINSLNIGDRVPNTADQDKDPVLTELMSNEETERKHTSA